MWIKICGLTTPDAVSAALEARVDAIGFVFSDSVRRVTPDEAARLAQGTPPRVLRVAVTRDPTQALLDEILAVFRPDVLQTDADDFMRLRLPAPLARLPVLRGAPPQGARPPARVLFEGAHSGTGRVSDWQAARSLAALTELVLAGGLNSDNVGAAVAAVGPFGVDVSSGVELRPGIKNPAEIVRFVLAARAAGAVPRKESP
ncbi:MAG TPA: phosphoribosylanthranilate isomerase [Steroidobacteraceae bacterium]|jgi:phosphoribosylanthranilate isomerase|nr:phosphoribosylanthranilate isomerase [Steroidobacteraceae bacterium]